MYCPSCGSYVLNDGTFCGNCGKRLTPQQPVSEQPTRLVRPAQPPQRVVYAPQPTVVQRIKPIDEQYRAMLCSPLLILLAIAMTIVGVLTVVNGLDFLFEGDFHVPGFFYDWEVLVAVVILVAYACNIAAIVCVVVGLWMTVAGGFSTMSSTVRKGCNLMQLGMVLMCVYILIILVLEALMMLVASEYGLSRMAANGASRSSMRAAVAELAFYLICYAGGCVYTVAVLLVIGSFAGSVKANVKIVAKEKVRAGLYNSGVAMAVMSFIIAFMALYLALSDHTTTIEMTPEVAFNVAVFVLIGVVGLYHRIVCDKINVQMQTEAALSACNDEDE